MCLSKIPRRHLIYSFVALFAFFFTLFSASSSVSAVSNSITCVWTLPSVLANQTYSFSNCADFTSAFSTDVYVRVDYDFDITWTSSSSVIIFLGLGNNVYQGGTSSSGVIYRIRKNKPSDSSVLHMSDMHFDFVPSLADFVVPTYQNSQNFSFSGTITFTIYDSFPSDCPPCPDCPPVPENPYDNKLDEIIRAIWGVGATMLAIYLFFCLYQIIKNAGALK